MRIPQMTKVIRKTHIKCYFSFFFLFLFNDLFTGDFLANRNIANFSFVVFFLDKFQSAFFVLNEQNEFNVLTTMNDMRA